MLISFIIDVNDFFNWYFIQALDDYRIKQEEESELKHERESNVDVIEV